jgi:hypothetical protein
MTISAGGARRWFVTGMNAFQQITGGTFGRYLNTTIGYDAYSAKAGSLDLMWSVRLVLKYKHEQLV